MNDFALELKGVYKRYGSVHALDGLDLQVPRGSITAFIGPNGAGKTTAFGILGRSIRADKGSVDILGAGVFDARCHGGRVSLVPQDCELNPHVKVVQLLSYYAQLQGYGQRAARREAERVLEAVFLSDRAFNLIRGLSHGMRRRVALAQALIGEPELILLDEPTAGLDPELVAEIKNLIRGFRGRATVMVSSHVLNELQSICDHVVILERGRCRQEASLDEITGQGQTIRVLFAKPIDCERLRPLIAGIEFEALHNQITFTAPEAWSVPQLNASVLPALLEVGAEVLEVSRGESLEQAFLAMGDR